MKRVFIRGLAFILPITLTVYLFFWLFKKTQAFSEFIGSELGLDFLNFPGSGIFFILVFIMGIGFLSLSSFFDKIMSLTLQTIEKVPIVKSIFGPIRDLMRFIGDDAEKQGRKVVLVPNGENYCLGIVTNTTQAINDEKYNDMVSVYLPMSYNVGGYTIVISKDKIIEIDMEVDKAVKLAITGWINKD